MRITDKDQTAYRVARTFGKWVMYHGPYGTLAAARGQASKIVNEGLEYHEAVYIEKLVGEWRRVD